MSTKERVLELLLTRKGIFTSGEDIARELSLSRNAIWRAMESLRADGWEIDAVTNKGYSLLGNPVLVRAETIKPLLSPDAPFDVKTFKTVTSTNTLLKAEAERDAPEGRIFIASEQTGGKGRMGRSFYSPLGTGVYISILLRPTFSPSESLCITTAAAVAMAEAIEATAGTKPRIKWVNDIYVNEKKVCGILTEAAFDMEQNRLRYAVLGIGINLVEPEGGYPQDIAQVASPVFTREEYSALKRDELIAALINRFWHYYEHLTDKEFLAGYQNRSMLDGREVNVIGSGCLRPAVALGVDDEFRLRVRYPDGSEELLQSGDVSVKPRA